MNVATTMKKQLFVYIVSLILTCSFLTVTSAAAQSGAELPPDMQRIVERGKLIVGLYSEDMPPFYMTNEQGELYGADIELAQDIADALSVNVEFKRTATSYQALYQQVARGEVDVVIAKFSRTLERAASIRYTKPYMELRWALMVNQLAATQKRIGEYPLDYLRSQEVKIGARAETSWVEHARQMFPQATIVEYAEWDQAVAAVTAGEVIAVLYDEGEVIRLVRQNPDVALYLTIYVLTDKKDYLSIAVPYDSTHLLAWLNIYLETNQVHWDINSLMKKYPQFYE